MRAIEDFTGFPEMMDGRVKTLHPRLYAGLLARRDDDAHLRAAAEQGIEQVDLVCVNLYPFEQTVARGDATEEEVDREHRHRRPDDDPGGREEQRVRRGGRRPGGLRRRAGELREADGRISLATPQALAAKAFACTARYDAAIATLVRARGPTRASRRRWRESYEKVTDLRYGENPHQQAAFYARVGAPTHLLEGVEQLHGKELSFNNLLDLSSARELVEEFAGPACAIVKHNNPCGCALGESGQEAYERAFACDPESAYGGVIARQPAASTAPAPSAGRAVHRGAARARLRRRTRWRCCRAKKNVRLLELARLAAAQRRGTNRKPVLGGQLVQTRDASPRRASRCAR